MNNASCNQMYDTFFYKLIIIENAMIYNPLLTLKNVEVVNEFLFKKKAHY